MPTYPGLITIRLTLIDRDSRYYHAKRGNEKAFAGAVKANEDYARLNNVRFEYRNDIGVAHVSANSGRLLEVVNNLLSNSAKFSPDGDVIEVAVSRHEGRVRLPFAGHGLGIPEELSR